MGAYHYYRHYFLCVVNRWCCADSLLRIHAMLSAIYFAHVPSFWYTRELQAKYLSSTQRKLVKMYSRDVHRVLSTCSGIRVSDANNTKTRSRHKPGQLRTNSAVLKSTFSIPFPSFEK